MTLQLVGTPLSHFTRKLRILLAELEVPYDFVRVSSVLATAPGAYGDNPLMRVPTLIDGTTTLIESDHIARYLVHRHDRGDPLRVLSEAPDDLNRLAVTNGIMANEVVLILARRGGLTDEEMARGAYFAKLTAAIHEGLAWLDARADRDAPAFDYRDATLVSMWEHLAHYKLVDGLDRYRALAARVERFASRPSVASTTPATSLADATAAGWKPA